MKGIINFGLFIFFAFSLLVTFGYFVALYEKIKQPNIRNLRSEDFLLLGMIVIAFLIADFFIIKRLIKKR